MAYAQNTEVPIEKSKAEIERLVRRHGAVKFVSSWDNGLAIIVFVCKNRMIRFTLPLPTMTEAARTGAGQHRSESARSSWVDKEERRRWRALLLCIKAKLESVEEKIESFDEAFLSHIVTDDKRTVYERLMDPKTAPLKMLAGTAPVAEAR